jgi:hypothetical protein
MPHPVFRFMTLDVSLEKNSRETISRPASSSIGFDIELYGGRNLTINPAFSTASLKTITVMDSAIVHYQTRIRDRMRLVMDNKLPHKFKK